jgi:NTE family protein
VSLVCFDYDPESEGCIEKLVNIFGILVNNYHYIILDLPSRMDQFVLNILNQSDLIHLLSSPETVDLRRTRNLIERLRSEFNFKESKIKVIINEYKSSRLRYSQQIELLDYDIFATLPKIDFTWDDRLILNKPDCEYAKAVRRISRQTTENLVGLVLGVGAGYGFCHIGVLKVFEEENIPIDIICGASMGAIIAALWTIGNSSQEILKIADELKGSKYVKNLVDFTFPALGFLKGRKLFRFLKKYLGNKTFYDTKIPLKVIASDIKKREPIVIDKGALLDALMASCAMPGLFRPFRFKDDLLLDGGVTNPLPTEVLFKMGVKKIIAVNVTPSEADIIRQNNRIKEQVRLNQDRITKDTKRNLISYLKDRFNTNIFDIIANSFEVLQSEMSKKEAQLADVVLHPDMQGLHWLELDKAREFTKRGEEETRRNLTQIKQLVNE